MEQLKTFSSYRDEHKTVRILNHNQAPVRKQTENSLQLAKEYINDVAGEYNISKNLLKQLDNRPSTGITDEGESFKLNGVKKMMDTTIVDYAQTYFGLPVWRSGVTVVMQDAPLQVVSSSNSSHQNVSVHKPKTDADKNGLAFNHYQLHAALGYASARDNKNDFKINQDRLVVFKYEADKRFTDHPENEQEKNRQEGFREAYFTIPMPDVNSAIKDGEFYVVHEILFTYTLPNMKTLNWRAMVEVETNSVLYLRALTDNFVSGMVFKCDPITDSGSTANNPNASSATLDAVRTSTSLPGLSAPVSGTQALTGEYVRVIDDETPTIAPPTETSPYAFNFTSRSNNFAAVNAYYHCDKFFRMLHDLGFDIPSYFDGTSFPVHIDHRGHFLTSDGIEVNASCNGNSTSNGIGLVDFELATLTDTTNPVGIVVDFKVVLHELGGHGILWDHVGHPNFGFCHSAGDSVAVITNDPESNAPDRFETFPFAFYTFSSGKRRHDRTLADGWGWGGYQDDGGYGSEQIMSTTMFRIYRSIGGDHWDVNRRKLASQIAVYLIVRAVGTLTPMSNPSDPTGFETALENADSGNFSFLNPAQSYAGGAYYKVIRWAFEKQSLFRASGDDATHEGQPPAVDVYINDGRNGEYQFLANHWSCTDIWNRRHNTGDGGGVHEEPIVGVTNYAYVKIKNRGTQTATNIVVKGYHAKPGVGLTYPDDWMAMDTNQLVVSNLASGAQQIVGPFEWTPSEVGHECMFMSVSALHDPSNIDGRITGSIPEWRLVPNDNNIAQRNVSPVSGASNLNLILSIANLPFWVRNPNAHESKITLEAKLPEFLTQRGWKIEFSNAGGGNFSLQPRAEKKIEMRMIEGREFSKEDVLNAKEDNMIYIYANADGNLIGGMTYNVDPNMKHPSNYHQPETKDDCDGSIKDWIKRAEADVKNIKSVKVKRITLDIDFKTDCNCD